jgi:hypothetical protein
LATHLSRWKESYGRGHAEVGAVLPLVAREYSGIEKEDAGLLQVANRMRILGEFPVELMKPPIAPRAMPTSITKNPSTDRPFMRPAADAVPLVEPSELSQFEGEGSPAAPILELVDVPKRLRRLKRNELVTRGDFVVDMQRGFEPWEGPGGFRADAFLKPVYRRDASRSTATERLPKAT